MLVKNSKWLLVIASLIIVALALGACGGSPATTAPSAATNAPPTAATATTAAPVASARGSCGTLKLLWWQAPTILNPHLGSGTKDSDASRLTLEPLAATNEQGVPDARYGLAAEVPTVANGGISADGKTITWKLKAGVKWSDGSPFSADDVVFTYTYVSDAKTAATTSANYVDIDKIEKVNDTTVKITWKNSQPLPYIAFVGSNGMIIQKKAFENFMGEKAKDAPTNLKPIGTGPYVVREFKPGDVVIYDMNPNFRDPDKPCFKEVNLKGGGDATSAARSALQTGDIDYAWNLQVSADVLQELLKGGKGEFVSAVGASLERITINRANPDPALGEAKRSEPSEKHPFLSDLRVRQALALAVDRKTIGDQLYGDGLTGKATCIVITAPPALVSTTKSETCDFNLDKANKLLDDAGWVKGTDGIRAKDGVKMKMVYQTSINPVRQKTQTIVKQGWEKLGISVELKSTDAGVFFGTASNPDAFPRFYADVEEYANSSGPPDDLGRVRGWTCAEIKTKDAEWRGANVERYCDPEFDKLVDALNKELDPAKRATLYKQINDKLVADVVIIPLVARNFPIAGKSKALKGIVANPWDGDLWNVADWTNK